MTRYQKILITLLTCINFTHILDFMIMMPLGNRLMPYFHIGPQSFSKIVAAYNISAFVSGLLSIFFVDKFDRKKILLVAYIGFVIGTFFCGLAPTANVLLGCRIIAGLFGGIMGAQVLSIVSDNFPYEKRAQAMGFLFAAFSLASVIGVPLGLFLADTVGWHSPFFLVAGMGCVIIPLLILLVKPVTAHLQQKEDRERSIDIFIMLIKSKLNLTAFALSATLMLGHFIIIPFLNPFMEYNVGFNNLQRNLVYIVGGIVTIVSAPLAGKLADKFGKHQIFFYFGILSLIPIFLITNLTPMSPFIVLTVTGIWFMLASSRNIPAQALISNVVEPKYRGSFQSLNSCVTSAFVGLATLAAGWIVEKTPSGKLIHYNQTGYVSIAFIILALFIVRAIPKYTKP